MFLLSFVNSVWIYCNNGSGLNVWGLSLGNCGCSVCLIWLVGVLVLVVFCDFWLGLVKDIVGVGVCLGCLL